MINKSPVYHLTKNGRKVVWLDTFNDGTTALVWDFRTRNTYTFKADELTPWVEPETRTYYLGMIDDKWPYVSLTPLDRKYYRGTKTITITEGEFDE